MRVPAPRSYSLAVHDDGSGDALFVGGVFTSAGGVNVNRIAKWDGSNWFALSDALGTGVDGGVEALMSHDDGSGASLYIGGLFAEAGGVDTFNIARWDGSSFSALNGPFGPGVDGRVDSLMIADTGSGPELLLAGRFTHAGGIAVDHIAKWNGTEFEALGTASTAGPDGYVLDVAWGDGVLYAGGPFLTINGQASSRLGRWSCRGDLLLTGFDTGDTRDWSATLP